MFQQEVKKTEKAIDEEYKNKLKDLIKHASEEKYNFISLADSKLHGSYELFQYAKKYNIF